MSKSEYSERQSLKIRWRTVNFIWRIFIRIDTQKMFIKILLLDVWAPLLKRNKRHFLMLNTYLKIWKIPVFKFVKNTDQFNNIKIYSQLQCLQFEVIEYATVANTYHFLNLAIVFFAFLKFVSIVSAQHYPNTGRI